VCTRVGAWLLAFVASATCTLDAHAAPLVVGLSDQHETTFSDLRFRTLPIQHVRVVVPWDAATTEPVTVERWLNAARARGLEPLVSFERSRGDQCPAAPCVTPSRSEFGDAFRAFRLRWPHVIAFAPWNEPNHSAQPYVLSPKAAAGLHDELRTACPACTVVAGDVVDNASMKGWILDYQAALKTSVQVWGIHNYGDVTYERASYLTWLANRTAEPIWITETGGIVRLSGVTYPESRATDAVRKAFALADTHAGRVERLYLYQWQAALHESFDAGLVRWDGSARPGLDVVRARLGEIPPRPEPTPMATAPDPPSSDDPVTTSIPDAPIAGTALSGGGRVEAVAGTRPVAAAAARRSRRGYQVLVRCPATRTHGCRGRLTLAARPQQPARGVTVRLGSAALRVRAGQSTRVEVRIPARRMRTARAFERWRLVATVVLRDPASLAETSWSRRS
jgi:hypothetical protein